MHSETGLPEKFLISKGSAMAPQPHTLDIAWHTLAEQLDREHYIYREQEARVSDGKRSLGLRLGWMLPGTSGDSPNDFTWWQWCAAEPAWSGPVAEAWRLGGHLATYSRETKGGFPKQDGSNLLDLGKRIVEEQGDILHADIWLVWWRCGLVQIRAHFKTTYFHVAPRPLHGFPVIAIGAEERLPDSGKFADGDLVFPLGAGHVSLGPSALMFENGAVGRWFRPESGVAVLRPWEDLRVLANKDRINTMHYLPPASPDVMPEGVSRTFSLNISFDNTSPDVGRYAVPASWYQQCGVVASDVIGSATRIAKRGANLLRAHTQRGGFDTGCVWRYMRRDLRSGVPQEDGAEWDGDTAAGLWTLAYQTGENPGENWPLYEAIAVHAADVAVHHGHSLQRLENSIAFTAPLPKFRFRGILTAYLETGDPYLLDVAQALAGSYMAINSANLPRSAIGRDAWPVTSLLDLHDYSDDSIYLRAARRCIANLLLSQESDGGFSGQAGAGRISGIAAVPATGSIGFGSGLLAPIAIFEWERRDPENRPPDFGQRIKLWADLMHRRLEPEGFWSQNPDSPSPYPLISTGAFFSLPQAALFSASSQPIKDLAKAIDYLEDRALCVDGTHAFLGCLYSHFAEASLATDTKQPVKN